MSSSTWRPPWVPALAAPTVRSSARLCVRHGDRRVRDADRHRVRSGYPNDDRILTQIPSGTFTKLSTAFDTGCALRANGTAACWGFDPNNFGRTSPPDVAFASVHVSEVATCGFDTSGRLHCWGYFTRMPLD